MDKLKFDLAIPIEGKKRVFLGTIHPTKYKYNCFFIRKCDVTSDKLSSNSPIFPSFKIGLFELKKKFKDPFYIQIFSKRSSICRIFLYKKMRKCYACVECFDEGEKVSNIVKFSNKVLNNYFNLSLKSEPLVDKVRKRYSLLTIKDFKTINSFKIDTIKTNLISYPWEIYSREGKLEEVNKKLHKFL